VSGSHLRHSTRFPFQQHAPLDCCFFVCPDRPGRGECGARPTAHGAPGGQDRAGPRRVDGACPERCDAWATGVGGPADPARARLAHLLENPGDAGLATSFSWKLPVGVQAGEIAWPTPRKFPLGNLANYGYTDTVLLPVPLLEPGLPPRHLPRVANRLIRPRKSCITMQPST